MEIQLIHSNIRKKHFDKMHKNIVPENSNSFNTSDLNAALGVPGTSTSNSSDLTSTSALGPDSANDDDINTTITVDLEGPP